MAASRFSRRAAAGLLSIGEYTLRTWGERQATRYIGDPEACCHLLAGNPALGRNCDDVRPGLLRMESGRHIVFYRRAEGRILISRILHRSMLPEKHAIDDDDLPPAL